MLKYDAFASPDFDANDYANAILAGEPFPPPVASAQPGKIAKAASLLSSLSEPAKGDISVAISKLTVGLDDVSKQIKSVVRYFSPFSSTQALNAMFKFSCSDCSYNHHQSLSYYTRVGMSLLLQSCHSFAHLSTHTSTP